MRSGGPAYTVLAVDHIKHIDGEAVKAVVKSFFISTLPAEHGSLEAVAQTRRLLVGKSNSPPETGILSQESLHTVPTGFLASRYETFTIVGKPVLRYPLKINQRKIGDLCPSAPKSHSTRVMVGGHHNQRLVGVSEIKPIGHIYRLLKIHHLPDDRSAVIGM